MVPNQNVLRLAGAYFLKVEWKQSGAKKDVIKDSKTLEAGWSLLLKGGVEAVRGQDGGRSQTQFAHNSFMSVTYIDTQKMRPLQQER